MFLSMPPRARTFQKAMNSQILTDVDRTIKMKPSEEDVGRAYQLWDSAFMSCYCMQYVWFDNYCTKTLLTAPLRKINVNGKMLWCILDR